MIFLYSEGFLGIVGEVLNVWFHMENIRNRSTYEMIGLFTLLCLMLVNVLYFI